MGKLGSACKRGGKKPLEARTLQEAMQSQSEGVHIMVDFDAESEEDLVQVFAASAQLHHFALGERVV